MMTLACENFFQQALERGDFEMMVVFGVGGTIALVAILAGTITSVLKTRAKEATKREIAAYVAEGSINPEDAIAMLNAGQSLSERIAQSNVNRT